MTSDIWPSQSNDPFTCVTTYYTYSNQKLNKKILDFHIVYYPHDELAINDSLTSIFREFDIQSKIFSIKFDNTSKTIQVSQIFFVRMIREDPLSEMFM